MDSDCLDAIFSKTKAGAHATTADYLLTHLDKHTLNERFNNTTLGNHLQKDREDWADQEYRFAQKAKDACVGYKKPSLNLLGSKSESTPVNPNWKVIGTGKPDEDDYEVVVGNIGSVYKGSDKQQAIKDYEEYIKQSRSGRGKAAGEDVTLLANGEIAQDHLGSNNK